MGYSVTTPMNSGKAKREMLEFLTEHYRPLTSFLPENINRYEETFPDYDPSVFIRTEDGSLDSLQRTFIASERTNLDYDSGASKIGFNYRANVYWPFQVCQWMALRSGRKRRFKSIHEGTLSVPYYVYDGSTAVPLIIKEGGGYSVEDVFYEVVEPSGFRAHPDALRALADGIPRGTTCEDAFRFSELCKKELERLTQLWES